MAAWRRSAKTRRATAAQAENKKNIAYHYDVSNAFYELWLDPEMVYTCGYFMTGTTISTRPSGEKLEMICRKLRLQPGETLLDIGCGWGAFSLLRAPSITA